MRGGGMFIAGRPAPQGSKRHVGGGRMIEASKYVAPWRKVIASEAARLWAGAPLVGPISVELEFVLPRPASEPKRITRPADRRPDLDKLVRAVLDGLTGPVFPDDSQVVHLCACKRTAAPGEPTGVHAIITPAEGELAGYNTDGWLADNYPFEWAAAA